MSLDTHPGSRPRTPVTSDSTVRKFFTRSRLRRLRQQEDDQVGDKTTEELLAVNPTSGHRDADDLTLHDDDPNLLRCTRGSSPNTDPEQLTAAIKDLQKANRIKKRQEAAARLKRLNVEGNQIPIRSPPKESRATIEKKEARERRSTNNAK